MSELEAVERRLGDRDRTEGHLARDELVPIHGARLQPPQSYELRTGVSDLDLGTDSQIGEAGTRVGVTDGSARIQLAVGLPGGELAGRVELRTVIALADGGRGRQPLAALIPGSVIWDDSTTVALEGAGSRFPMEWLDFAAASWLPPGAGWYLDWTHDAPEAPALGAVRLYLNSGHEAVRAAVTSTTPTPEDQVIRDVIEYDVARTLILGALRADPGPWDAAAAQEGSVAAVVRRLIVVVFPTDTMEGLRNRFTAAPQHLEVRFQDGLRLFHDIAH